jgi:hypothetical protein
MNLWARYGLWFLLLAPFAFFPGNAAMLALWPSVLVRLGVVFIAVQALVVWRPWKGALLGLTLLYLLSSGLVLLTAPDTERALWGAPGRYTGVVDTGLWVIGALALSSMLDAWSKHTLYMVRVGLLMVPFGMLITFLGFSDSLRIWAPAPNPGFLAAYFLGAFPVALMIAWGRLMPGKERLGWLAVVLLLAGMVLTQTRMGLVGAGIASALMLFHPSGIRLSLRGVLMGALVLCVLLAGVWTWRAPSVFLAGDRERLEWWGVAGEMLTQAPSLSGYGPGGFLEAGLVSQNGLNVDAPHNIYLQEVVERGMLAIPTFSLLTYTFLVLWRRRDALAGAYACGLAGFAVYGIMWLPSLQMGLWLMLYLAYALRVERAEREEMEVVDE